MSKGKNENRASERGSDNRKGHQPTTIKSEEHVGSSGSHGVRFKMPTDNEVCDHSVIRKLGA